MPKGQNLFELVKWLDEGISTQQIDTSKKTVGNVSIQQYVQDLVDKGDVEIQNEKYIAAGEFRKRLDAKRR